MKKWIRSTKREYHRPKQGKGKGGPILADMEILRQLQADMEVPSQLPADRDAVRQLQALGDEFEYAVSNTPEARAAWSDWEAVMAKGQRRMRTASGLVVEISFVHPEMVRPAREVLGHMRKGHIAYTKFYPVMSGGHA